MTRIAASILMDRMFATWLLGLERRRAPRARNAQSGVRWLTMQCSAVGRLYPGAPHTEFVSSSTVPMAGASPPCCNQPRRPEGATQTTPPVHTELLHLGAEPRWWASLAPRVRPWLLPPWPSAASPRVLARQESAQGGFRGTQAGQAASGQPCCAMLLACLHHTNWLTLLQHLLYRSTRENESEQERER